MPTSVDAERAVLGAILLNREAIVAVADTLRAEHFYLERHHQIYAAALALFQARTPPDLRTLSEELRRRGQLDQVGGIIYLADLVDATPTSAHIDYYALDMLKTATRRRLLTVGGRIAALAYDESEDIQAIMTTAHDLLDGAAIALHDPRYTPFSATDLEQEALDPIAWAVTGLLPQGLTLLVGKPKMRKSWLALALAIAIASGGRALGSIPVEEGDVLYLALEDGKLRLQSRQRKILGGAGAPKRLSYLTAAPRLDAGCVGLIETWLRLHPEARLVIIDVLAKVRPAGKGGSMYDEDYGALEPLQQLASRRGVAILVVHHMNRSGADDVFDQINGSNGIGGSADGLLTLQYERGQTDATLHINGRDVEDDASLALRWDNATAQWILLGKAEEVKASTQRQEIIKTLREERRPMTPREVAEALDKVAEYGNIKQLMYRMAREKDLSSSGGKYTVPSLTLLAPEADRNGRPGDPVIGSGDPVILGDPGPITQVYSTRTPENSYGDPGDRKIPPPKKLDHPDHPITQVDFTASESQKDGDLPRITQDHPTLADLAPVDRLQLALYLRSNMERDQEIARDRCAAYGIDYEAARAASKIGGAS